MKATELNFESQNFPLPLILHVIFVNILTHVDLRDLDQITKWKFSTHEYLYQIYANENLGKKNNQVYKTVLWNFFC